MNTSNDTKVRKEKKDDKTVPEVTFLNGMTTKTLNAAELGSNVLLSEYDQTENEDDLYAFLVELDHYYDRETERYKPLDYPVEDDYGTFTEYYLEKCRYEAKKAAELMEKAGLTVLQDYPYCCYNNEDLAYEHESNIDRLAIGLCTVVGTMDEIRRVFEETDFLEGWVCIAWSAPRPDLIERVKAFGWTGDADSLTIDFSLHGKYKKECFGSENQVKVGVNIE